MDSSFDFVDGFSTMSPNSEDQFSNLINEYTFNQLSTPPTTDLNFLESPNLSSDLDLGPTGFKPSITTTVGLEGQPYDPPHVVIPPMLQADFTSYPDDSDFSETILKYINQILMEENIENKPCMFHDPLGLKDTEKSFYDALGQENPPFPNQNSVESPVFSSSSGDYGTNSTGSSSTVNDSLWQSDLGEHNYQPSLSPLPVLGEHDAVQSNFNPTDQSQFFGNLSDDSVNHFGDGLEVMAQNIFTDSESILQFRRGLDEASKFLPKSNNLVIDLERNTVSWTEWKGEDLKVESLVVKGEKESDSSDGSRGRKNHEREEIEIEEGRSNKQTAVYVEESEEAELSEMLDKVLLCTDAPASMCGDNCEPLQSDASKASLQTNGQAQGGNGGKGSRNKKQGKKKETVDLRSLLILCAQAVSTGDGRTAIELLKQVRQHSTPFGDGSQRVAHFFANGLEARLAGTSIGSQMVYKRVSALEKLKAYQVYLSACPFKRFSYGFSNKMILHAAEKATTLHIVDFGIQYGFQWPLLIQFLSKSPEGAPKLRITGIDLPQPGFRPAECIEETGRRLERYCNRFNVPFEYNAIASQNWETIRIEELKIERNEVLAVNCAFQMMNLLDETVEGTSPRNAVLNLIRRMKPDIFVNSIVNGSFNAPFFLTRFREALFHFSGLYDVFDVTIPRDNPERLIIEREFLGRAAINVIACEGLERVERPETYKQSQVRISRAGFKKLPLNQELMSVIRAKIKEWYHKDFILDEDSHWMLQGWKGRIFYASSCWVPA
ncbi:scarecrow-like protein 33 [Quercus robur]|uniref:scarecrow-like protein 33 n=1 Tax=Quercus robur TaxID=38942 RepID=UPI0021637F4E|nr:scarecrow-like protein 33 [Quercus robur]